MEAALETAGYEVRNLFAREMIERARDGLGEHIDRVARALEFPFAHTHPELTVERRLDAIAEHERSYAELLCTAGEGRAVVECTAGHCVFLDRSTPHRALENRSDSARFSLVVRAKPAAGREVA